MQREDQIYFDKNKLKWCKSVSQKTVGKIKAEKIICF